MHQQTITVSFVAVVLIGGALLLPHTWLTATPTSQQAASSAVSLDAVKKATDSSAQSFVDLQSSIQRFADELGSCKEKEQTVSPTTLAEQAESEPAYPFTPTAEPVGKLKAETVYSEAKPGVVVVGGVFKCDKCNHWHVRCASGFVIRQDGLIVTNFHVIEAFKKVDALGIMTADGRVFPAKAVLAASKLNDLALLKVDAEHLQPLPVSTNAAVGATVFCISHPLMPNGKANCLYTFSRGIVAGKFTIHNEKQEAVRVLAVTCDYGSGSSGGAILNEHGAVVAVVCQAIPLSSQDHEKGVQMIWRFARPSCSIVDMLNSPAPKQTPTPGKEAPAAQQAEQETPPPAQRPKAEAPVAGPGTFALRPTDNIAMGYYRPVVVKLSEKPPIKPKSEPAYRSKKPLYGVLHLGDAANNNILVAIDEPESGEPRIYIDRKGDGDLANAGPGSWDRTNGPTLFANNVTIDVPYTSGKIPYKFSFYRFKTRNQDNLYYFRSSGREGEVTLDGKHYRVLIVDDNADGRFDDLANGSLVIDLNQDGTLERTMDSAEFFRLNEPFNVHGKVWKVAALSPDGLRIALRPSNAKVAIKAYLSPGCPAPTFTGTSLDGKPIDLKTEASKGKYILVDFWASWCGPCRGEFPTLRRVCARYQKHGLTILGVTLDSDKDRAIEAAAQAKLTYSHVFDGLGWKNAVALLYRVQGIPQTYLLDSQLKIVAKNLRGPNLEKRLQELLGPGDVEAANAVEQATPKAAAKPKSKPLTPKLPKAK
jgi:S1-C subfamily serine protease/thiol-disulfide isomerase/thioredoxin